MPSRLLVRAPNFIGDHVMARPFYEALRAAYPDARLTCLAPEPVLGVDTSAWFDETLVLGPGDRAFPGGAYRAGKTLRGRFDLGVTLPASISSALLLYAAGIPARVGFAEAGAELFLTASLRWPGRAGRRHKSELYLELLGFLTAREAPLPAPPRARRGVTVEPLIVVAPGASLPLREWPYFLELLVALRTRYPGYSICVVGSGGEEKWHSFLRRLADPGVTDLVGRTSIDELVRLCARAAVVVANDSGAAHLAATMAGAPTVVLFGPGDPAYVAPRGPRVAVARVRDLPCSPCEKPYCRSPYGYQRCLRALAPEAVLEQVADILLF